MTFSTNQPRALPRVQQVTAGYKSIVISGLEFGIGLAKGTKSLVAHSIHGIFNSATKISGTIGRNVASFSYDEDYLKERNERNAREKPKNVSEGVILGVRDFG